MGSEQKHVLIVAYYFPPMGLSGVQRIAKMAKYLPEAGYRVTVLTVEPGSYFAFDDSLLAELESVEGIHIVRTRSLDPTRLHGGYRGKGHEGHREAHREVPFPEEKSRKVLSTISQFLLLPDNKIGWRKICSGHRASHFKRDPRRCHFSYCAALHLLFDWPGFIPSHPYATSN